MTWVARSLKTAPDLAINGRIEPTLIFPRNAESSWHAITKIVKRHIIDAAKKGERDPVRLRNAGLAALGFDKEDKEAG